MMPMLQKLAYRVARMAARATSHARLRWSWALGSLAQSGEPPPACRTFRAALHSEKKRSQGSKKGLHWLCTLHTAHGAQPAHHTPGPHVRPGQVRGPRQWCFEMGHKPFKIVWDSNQAAEFGCANIPRMIKQRCMCSEKCKHVLISACPSRVNRRDRRSTYACTYMVCRR